MIPMTSLRQAFDKKGYVDEIESTKNIQMGILPVKIQHSTMDF